MMPGRQWCQDPLHWHFGEVAIRLRDETVETSSGRVQVLDAVGTVERLRRRLTARNATWS